MRSLTFLISVAVAASLILGGCDSAQQKAKRMYEQGKFEEVIAEFNDDPTVAEYVDAARKVLGERLLAKKDYAAYLELHQDTPLAQQARERVAEELLTEEQYEEIMDQYEDTPAAAKAQTILKKRLADSLAADSADKAGSRK